MHPKKPSVLIVDDDVRMLTLVQRIIQFEGLRPIPVDSGERALRAFDTESPDLVLLDVMMPGMDGYETLRRIREFSDVAVVMVTARGQEDELVHGFEAGADDYVTKPFSARELAARVKAVLKRSKLWDEKPQPQFSCGDLRIDFVAHRVMVADREIGLTATEYKLLSYLARNAGRLVTPDQMLEKVWGREYLGETHLLQVNVARLRTKLGDEARNPRYITTRPNIGYMMARGD